MYRQWLLSGCVLGLSWMTACTNLPPQPPTSQDQQTETAKPAQAANRVVALSPLTADIIQSLDQTKLVGVPGSSLLNQDQRFAKTPIVSQGRSQPNLEQIIALKPDIVIGTTGFHDQTAAQLERLGIKTSLTQINSWQALEAVTKDLARLIGANPEPLLQRYQSILAAQLTQSPTTLVLVSRQPILTPNNDSWCGDLLARFRVRNLAAELSGESSLPGYITLSPEKVLQADPEVLIVVESGEDNLQQFKSQPFWSKLKAVKTNRVHVFDYYGLVNAGSIEAIEQTSTKLKQVLSSATAGESGGEKLAIARSKLP